MRPTPPAWGVDLNRGFDFGPNPTLFDPPQRSSWPSFTLQRPGLTPAGEVGGHWGSLVVSPGVWPKMPPPRPRKFDLGVCLFRSFSNCAALKNSPDPCPDPELANLGSAKLSQTLGWRKLCTEIQARVPVRLVHLCPTTLLPQANHLSQDFVCRRDVLLSQMKYFKSHISEDCSCDDLDISVHCDVFIFQWLMVFIHVPAGMAPDAHARVTELGSPDPHRITGCRGTGLSTLSALAPPTRLQSTVSSLMGPSLFVEYGFSVFHRISL